MPDPRPLPTHLAELERRVIQLETSGGGGGGYDGRMEARVAKLEAAIGHIESDMKDLKADVREVRSNARTDFMITWGALIAGFVGMAGMMAKGFHWL